MGHGFSQDELIPVAVTGGYTYAALDAGEHHACGLDTSTGDVYCWGGGWEGQIGNQSWDSQNTPTLVYRTGINDFVAMAAGGRHNCAVTESGELYCWGHNNSGQLGNDSLSMSFVPLLVSGSNTYASVAAGGDHSCALTNTDQAYCWGRNSEGQLGDGTNDDRSAPTAVDGGRTYSQLTAGVYHTCAIEVGGAAYCWGRGWNGQLGNNAGDDSNTPVAVAGGFTWLRLDAGQMHTCGITSGNELRCWGATGGSLYCWGQNQQGELGLGWVDLINTPTAVVGGMTFVTPPPRR
jgi:alpha-tubulin suppressor-like RCC1 family protein